MGDCKKKKSCHTITELHPVIKDRGRIQKLKTALASYFKGLKPFRHFWMPSPLQLQKFLIFITYFPIDKWKHKILLSRTININHHSDKQLCLSTENLPRRKIVLIHLPKRELFNCVNLYSKFSLLFIIC